MGFDKSCKRFFQLTDKELEQIHQRGFKMKNIIQKRLEEFDTVEPMKDKSIPQKIDEINKELNQKLAEKIIQQKNNKNGNNKANSKGYSEILG